MNRLVNEGVNALLAKYPEAQVTHGPEQTGFWVYIELNIGEFAIWNVTGNVYRVDLWGAVEDDPLIEITPLLHK